MTSIRNRQVCRLAIWFAAGLSACLAGECQAPKYQAGYVWDKTPASIMMNIGISMADFAPNRLVCLAGYLRRRYGGHEEITIYIFSSPKAARKYRGPIGGDRVRPITNWAAQNHAAYVYDADKNEEDIYIQPLGTGPPSSASLPDISTEIRLPAGVLPPCTLEIAHRCLLALDQPNYPEAPLRSKIGGTVTLEGVIDRGGRLRNIHAVSPADNLLADDAIRNLQTWRFESSAHADPVQIAFSYTLDPTERPFAVSVRFDLPDKVDIRAGPPR